MLCEELGSIQTLSQPLRLNATHSAHWLFSNRPASERRSLGRKFKLTRLVAAVCHLTCALFVLPASISGMRLFQSPIFLQFRVKSRGQRGLKVAFVRGYNVDTLWLCLLQNKVEELNQRLRQAMDGQCWSVLPSGVDTHCVQEWLFTHTHTLSVKCKLKVQHFRMVWIFTEAS